MIPSMTDPDIDEVLAIREELSAEFDHSPAKLVAYLIEIERNDPNQARYRHLQSEGACNPIMPEPIVT